MKASELIKELQECMKLVGDREVVYYDGGKNPVEVSGMWIQMVHVDRNRPAYFNLFHDAPHPHQYDMFNRVIPSVTNYERS